MIITVTEQIFLDEFKNSERHEQFSREALVALFEYFEECEGGGTPTELDVIAICCEFVEVDNDDAAGLENYAHCDKVAELTNSTVFIES